MLIEVLCCDPLLVLQIVGVGPAFEAGELHKEESRIRFDLSARQNEAIYLSMKVHSRA